jgi:hypothetical protein
MMIICPSCRFVHEEGGICISRQFGDLTLWNRSMSQGEIRALSFLDRGLNGIVVPRGLFMQSQFFASMNDSSYASFGPGNPLLGSTVMGIDNARELNSRVVQQLIAANLTLAEAWAWILGLERNSTGQNTSFPLVVTREVYTIGFDPMLMNVLPNMTVENSGNSSLPAPPTRVPTYWELMWNSFTGLVSAVWNAVVAVAQFIANVMLAVIKWGIGLAKAIAEGKGLEYIYETVVKPFVEALLAFIRFLIEFFKAILNVLFTPVRLFLESLGRAVRDGFRPAYSQIEMAEACDMNEAGDAAAQGYADRAAMLVTDIFVSIMMTAILIYLILMAVDVTVKPVATLLAGIVIMIALGMVLSAMAIAGFSGGYSGLPPAPGDPGGAPNAVMGIIPDDYWLTERIFSTTLRFCVTLAMLILDDLSVLGAISITLGVVSLALIFIGATFDKRSNEGRWLLAIGLFLGLLSVILATISVAMQGFGLHTGVGIAMSIGAFGMAYLNVLSM